MGATSSTLNQGTITEQAKLLYNVTQTADILSISVKSVRRLLERGLLKTNPAFRTKLITRASVEAFAKMTI
jgi:DNA-directed RNA polymerase specialized sigma24 family protein